MGCVAPEAQVSLQISHAAVAPGAISAAGMASRLAPGGRDSVSWIIVAASSEERCSGQGRCPGSSAPGTRRRQRYSEDTGVWLPPVPKWEAQADTGPGSPEPLTLWLLPALGLPAPLFPPLLPRLAALTSRAHRTPVRQLHLAPVHLQGCRRHTQARVHLSRGLGFPRGHRSQGPRCSSRQL